jgi:hypothetical protein
LKQAEDQADNDRQARQANREVKLCVRHLFFTPAQRRLVSPSGTRRRR